MHEMGIACSILEAVDRELRGYPRRRASKVAVRIGEFAGVDTESLRFCFEAMTKNSECGPMELEIEWCRAEDGCRGDELELAYLEIDDVGITLNEVGVTGDEVGITDDVSVKEMTA